MTVALRAAMRHGFGPLECRNVWVAGHRTSMRLEPGMWRALVSVAALEDLTIDTIVEWVGCHCRGANLSSATRAFLLNYFVNRANGRSGAVTPASANGNNRKVKGVHGKQCGEKPWKNPVDRTVKTAGISP